MHLLFFKMFIFIFKKNEKATHTKKKKNAVLRFLLEIIRGHG